MKTNLKFDSEKIAAYIRGLNAQDLKLRLKNLRYRASTIKLFVRVDIINPKTGKLVKTTGDRPSHSFVKAFLQLMELLTANKWEVAPDYVSIVDYGGTTRNSSFNIGQYHTRLMCSEAEAANALYGILVGTGTSTPANTDNAMETLIVNGSSAGQLQYGSCAVGAAAVVGANVDMVIARTFVNGSGGSITIREVGWVVRHAIIGTSTYYFLVAHDLVNQAVADGYIAVVSYTLRTTV